MKNIILFSALSMALFFSLSGATSACTARDAAFTLDIGNLNISMDNLNKSCTKETCTFSKRTTGPRIYDLITMRSLYDERVTLVISNAPEVSNSPYSTSWGMIVRLPYILKEEWTPLVSGIDPGKYDWKESVKTDLTFLKKAGILEIQDSDIEAISNQSGNGKNVFFCNNAWKALEANCDCKTCVKCSGAPILGSSLPEKQLVTPTTGHVTTTTSPTTTTSTTSTTVETTTAETTTTQAPPTTETTGEAKKEQTGLDLLPFFLLLFVIIVVTLAAVVLRKGKKPDKPPKKGLRGV
jgi:hypothetical protein